MYQKPNKLIVNENASKSEILEALNDLDEEYNIILDAMDVTMTLVDAHSLERKGGNLTFAKTLGYTLEEFHYIRPEELSIKQGKRSLSYFQEEILSTGDAVYFTQFRKKDGAILDFQVTSRLIKINNKDHIISTGRDITDLLKAEKERDKAYEEMEHKVLERTRELSQKTEILEYEIRKRQAVENELRKSQVDLSLNNNALEDMNTALKILLKKRDEEKSETEENIVSNVKQLIEPYLEQFKKTPLTSSQQSLLSVVESNLKEVVSPYLHRMFDEKYSVFTPREIQVANLVKVGRNTKEIAELLNMGAGTVEHHRKNIRKKLGLNKKGGNLRSYLISKANFPSMEEL